MTPCDPAGIAQRFGHSFNRPELLTAALTHRSAGAGHNERLEYLGDAVLGLVIADALFTTRPSAPEGDLSRLRARLVRKETLADIARELDLGHFLILGSGEQRNGGFRRGSILADAVEAMLGAVYLDAGFTAARDVVLQLFRSRLDDLPCAEQLKDAKTRLQEMLQADGRPLPEYAIVETRGAEHEQRFVARCTLTDRTQSAQGEDSSRRRAEQAAARNMITALEK